MTDIAGKGFLQNYTHNLKVVGSNPTPATNEINDLASHSGGFFFVCSQKIRKLVRKCGFTMFAKKGRGSQSCRHMRKKSLLFVIISYHTKKERQYV